MKKWFIKREWRAILCIGIAILLGLCGLNSCRERSAEQHRSYVETTAEVQS